jgi:hypothetical protein
MADMTTVNAIMEIVRQINCTWGSAGDAGGRGQGAGGRGAGADTVFQGRRDDRQRQHASKTTQRDVAQSLGHDHSERHH